MSQKLPEFMDIGKNPRNGTNTVNSADVHEGATRGCLAMCGQKKPLLDHKDAAGLNQFAKSVRASNCLTAYKYAAEEGSKALIAQSALFGQATTVAESKGIWEQMKKDISAQWDEVDSTFPEWKAAAAPLFKAIINAEAAYTRSTSRINIEAMKNYGK